MPSDVCPTLADGRWVIVSPRDAADIAAVTYDEAKVWIGKEIVVRGGYVAFDGGFWRHARRMFGREPDRFRPEFPYYVTYECSNTILGSRIAINLGKSCGNAWVEQDGMGYILHKKK